MRKISALLAVALVLPVLAACTSNPAAGCDAPFPSGDASSVVTAKGDVGAEPEVNFPTPLIAKKTEVSTLIPGNGDPIASGQPVLVEIVIVNGRTGEVIQKSGFSGENSGVLLTVGSETLPPVTEALECSTVGSRIVVAGTAEETHGGQAMADSDIEADDSFIFVVDVLDAYKAKADGATKTGNNGDPTVVLAPDGTPGITIPKSDPPTELVTSVLKQGDGATVKEGDYAVVHYTGVLWSDNEVFDSTWKKGSAAVFQLSKGAVVDGFVEGLVGQKVGSQVLLVVPPALGYGDQGSETIPAGSTLVFVVDILGIAGR